MQRIADVFDYGKKQKQVRNSKQMSLTLQSLPIEMVYRILEHLDDKKLFLSINNVYQSLNVIL